MKEKIIGIVVFGIMLIACNNSANKSGETTKNTGSVQQILTGYLQIKNALANDDGSDAANGGKIIVDALQSLDTTSLSKEQRSVLKNSRDDLKENATHIENNSSKIAHQREHFEMLSQDMYDLIKVSAHNQKIYKDYCPMYNKEGAIWLSETKEIKNPYLGKKMLTCGEVKEEIKK